MKDTFRIAVDIGGTFTDIQVLEEASGRTFAHKTPTTPRNPAEGLIKGISEAAQQGGFGLGQISALMHGTTIATNAVLERRFPQAALITTRGFEDVLEIGRHVRRDIYSQIAEQRALLIPRRHRFGVCERVGAGGQVLTDLDERQLDEIIARIDDIAINVVAVCCLHSYANPSHERRIAQRIHARIPNAHVSLSSVISPEAREYERTATTVLNALLMPIVGDYLLQLKSMLGEAGMRAPVYLVQSNGGVTTPEIAAEQPARLLLSGPSGGARAVEVLSQRLAMPNLIAIDMGGTSFDVSVVKDGAARLRSQGEVGDTPVRLPMLEIRTIGAGGGSIAGVDDSGRLLVGPISAGAVPGPAAYGRGGEQPTVTDANIALGRIDPGYFLSGEMALDADAARQAVRARVAAPLDLTIEQAASGVIDIAVTHMASAIRLSLFEKGLNPKDFALVSFGGAGGLHAALVAAELGAQRVLYPADAGTQSAWGMLFANIVQDVARSNLCVADEAALAELAATVDALRTTGEILLERAAVPDARRHYGVSFDMRYPGQGWEIGVMLPAPVVSPATLACSVAAFHATHQEQYAHNDENVTPEVVTVRLRAEGQLDKPRATAYVPPNAGADEVKSQIQREVFVDGAWRSVAVVERDAFTTDTVVTGPMIIEQTHATIYLPPRWRLGMDVGGVLIATADDNT